MPESTPHPTRFILLGASNLTIGFPLLVENLRRAAGGACEIFAAGGFGRSYGSTSRFLFRALPGITQSGLWEAVADAADSHRTFALLTDVGNDLLYGFPPEQIAGWVGECLRRLKTGGTQIILTLPPLESVRALSRWRYYAVRSLFFPNCRIPYAAIRDAAEELLVRIEGIGESNADAVVSLPGEWYGLDPIHIRRRHRPGAWRKILSAWNGLDLPERMATPARSLMRQIAKSREQARHVRGTAQHHNQPAIIDADLQVSLF